MASDVDSVPRRSNPRLVPGVRIFTSAELRERLERTTNTTDKRSRSARTFRYAFARQVAGVLVLLENAVGRTRFRSLCAMCVNQTCAGTLGVLFFVVTIRQERISRTRRFRRRRIVRGKYIFCGPISKRYARPTRIIARSFTTNGKTTGRVSRTFRDRSGFPRKRQYPYGRVCVCVCVIRFR